MKNGLIYLCITLNTYFTFGQSLYLSGSFQFYSPHFGYKADYPYQLKDYYGYNTSRTTWGVGYTSNEKSFFEVQYSRTPYRIHAVDDRQIPALPKPQLGVSGPGYFYDPYDAAYGSHDISLKYKHNLLDIGPVRLFGFAGSTLQLHPYSEPLRDLGGWPAAGDSSIFYRNTSPSVLLFLGGEAELAITKNIALWLGFTQSFGFSEILITKPIYHAATNTFPEGYRYTDGTGRAFNLGLRWYISTEYLSKRGLPQNKKLQFYAGLEYGWFRGKQKLPTGVFEYRSHPLDDQRKSFGIVAGMRRGKNTWEIGAYNLPSEISYSTTPYNSIRPWERQDFMHTSKHTLYLPIRYKRALFNFGKQSAVATISGSLGAGLNIAMPETFYSSKIINSVAPEETFTDHSSVFTSEAGMETSWHFWKLTLSGHVRYIHSFAPSRTVDFEWNDSKPVTATVGSGTITTTSTGWWAGASLRFNFVKND